jgi:hypothetical protein
MGYKRHPVHVLSLAQLSHQAVEEGERRVSVEIQIDGLPGRENASGGPTTILAAYGSLTPTTLRAGRVF